MKVPSITTTFAVVVALAGPAAAAPINFVNGLFADGFSAPTVDGRPNAVGFGVEVTSLDNETNVFLDAADAGDDAVPVAVDIAPDGGGVARARSGPDGIGASAEGRARAGAGFSEALNITAGSETGPGALMLSFAVDGFWSGAGSLQVFTLSATYSPDWTAIDDFDDVPIISADFGALGELGLSESEPRDGGNTAFLIGGTSGEGHLYVSQILSGLLPAEGGAVDTTVSITYPVSLDRTSYLSFALFSSGLEANSVVDFFSTATLVDVAVSTAGGAPLPDAVVTGAVLGDLRALAAANDSVTQHVVPVPLGPSWLMLTVGCALTFGLGRRRTRHG